MLKKYWGKFKKIFQKKIKSEPVSVPEMPKKEIKQEVKDASPEALRALLEKNLKWSQIIYEQNRKINRALWWSAFAGWSRFVIIVAFIILSIVFSLPIIRDVWQKYNQILGSISSPTTATNNTIDELIRLLPIEPAKQQQLKELLK